MSRATPEKISTTLVFGDGTSHHWFTRPGLLQAKEAADYSTIAPICELPARVTSKFIASLATKADTKATVYHAYTLRSDYWQQTSHPTRWAEYHLSGDKWVKVKNGFYTE